TLWLVSFADLFPEGGAGADAALEGIEAEVFVGAVQVVGVLSPAEQQSVDPQDRFEGADDGDGAPFADQNGGLAEARFDRFLGGPHPGGMDVAEAGRGAVVRLELEPDSRRAAVAEELFEAG